MILNKVRDKSFHGDFRKQKIKENSDGEPQSYSIKQGILSLK